MKLFFSVFVFFSFYDLTKSNKIVWTISIWMITFMDNGELYVPFCLSRLQPLITLHLNLFRCFFFFFFFFLSTKWYFDTLFICLMVMTSVRRKNWTKNKNTFCFVLFYWSKSMFVIKTPTNVCTCGWFTVCFLLLLFNYIYMNAFENFHHTWKVFSSSDVENRLSNGHFKNVLVPAQLFGGSSDS